jgi:hypothetical protein
LIVSLDNKKKMPGEAKSVQMIRKLSPYVTASVAVAALYTAYVFGSRWLENRRIETAAEEAARIKAQREIAQIEGGGQLKILQFYATPGLIGRGQRALVCYGTVNATSVRLEPSEERMYPALSRCFEVAPSRDTRYTLIAEDANGHTARQSFVLQVK